MRKAPHPGPAIMRGLMLTALAAVTACGTEPAPATRAVVRDSAGVRIVEHPDGLDLQSWALSAEPEAVIGHLADEDPAHQFTQIRGAVRLSDGRIVVGDWGSREARYFDPGGHSIASSVTASERVISSPQRTTPASRRRYSSITSPKPRPKPKKEPTLGLVVTKAVA